MDEQPKGTILSGCRILDLTDEKGMFSTRILPEAAFLVKEGVI